MSVQKLKMTCNFVDVQGVGTILCKKGFRDAQVYGYFERYGFYFCVSQSVDDPSCFVVTECSTGCSLDKYYYGSIEDALTYSLKEIENRRYYLFTKTAHQRVLSGIDLLKRNTTDLRTLAINSLLWNM